MRNLILVLGDQLDRRSAAFDRFDVEQDAVWMAEVEKEATHVWCHKLRLAAFFSAMRHFRDELRVRDIEVVYHELTNCRSDDSGSNFADLLKTAVNELGPERLIVLQPGDDRVRKMLVSQAADSGVEFEIREDDHFYCSISEFQNWAEGRKRLVLEDFYRHLRRKHNVLVTSDGEPVGGEWNFDAQNRETFGADGPGDTKAPRSFRVDTTTDEVIQLVEQRFADHPGTLEHFDLPLTHKQARALLRDFTNHRLPGFGTWQETILERTPIPVSLAAVFCSQYAFAEPARLCRRRRRGLRSRQSPAQ